LRVKNSTSVSKAETLDTADAEDTARHITAKRFEAALCVLNTGNGNVLHEKVEGASHRLAIPGLMYRQI
jgi:hypothetical protein